MQKLKLICIVAVLLDFVCGLLFAIKPNANMQLLDMLMFLILMLLLLVSFVGGICVVHRDKINAFIPTLICLIGLPASLFIASYLGVSIRDWQFQKNLPRYIQVVHKIEKNELRATPSSSRIQLPDEFADLSLATFAKTNNNGLIIEFIIGVGFPVKHSGYLFVSTGKIENDPDTLERWPYRSRINTNWFRISD